MRRGRPRLVSGWRRASVEAMRREEAKTCFGGTETNTALLRKAASNSYVLKFHYDKPTLPLAQFASRTAILINKVDGTAQVTYKKRASGLLPEALSKDGGYLLSHLRSTIGVNGLNFSVRNGKRWNPVAITT